MFKKNTKEDFIAKFKPQLEEFIKNGGDIDSLTKKDELFYQIKSYHLKDEYGKEYGIDEKFKILEIERKVKVVKDVKQALIDEIEEYLKNGGSLHVERKKLPFEKRLQIYSNFLKNQGIFKTHEEIMHDLGYPQYSDLYFKCSGLKEINKYEDLDGYIDSYHDDICLNRYVGNVARSVIKVPLYILITLILNKKTEKYAIEVDYIDYVKNELTKHAKEYGTLKGLRPINLTLYNRFDYLVHMYSDGSEENFSKAEWLKIFGLSDYSHDFKEIEFDDYDIEYAINNIKSRFGDKVIFAKDLGNEEYNLILKKSIKMGTTIRDVMKQYGLNYNSIEASRLSSIYTDKIPYLKEMKNRRDELMEMSGISRKNGYCKEQVFCEKVRVCKQVYDEFKNLIQEELIGEKDITNIENEIV